MRVPRRSRESSACMRERCQLPMPSSVSSSLELCSGHVRQVDTTIKSVTERIDPNRLAYIGRSLPVGAGQSHVSGQTHLQCRVQTASRAGILDGAENDRPSQPRAAAPNRSYEPLEGGVSYAR